MSKQQQPSRTDILVAIEAVKGEVNGMRKELMAHIDANTEVRIDHEKRLRFNERSIQRGKGAMGAIGASMGLIVAAFAYVLKGGPT